MDNTGFMQSRGKAVERSLHEDFSRTILRRFTKALEDFRLTERGDKIAVCISGGKDSMLMSKLFQEKLSHGSEFEAVYLVMDPGYSPENRAAIEKKCRNTWYSRYYI